MTPTAARQSDEIGSLTDFEGKPVVRAGIEIPGVAGGLREALRIEPRESRQGETAWLALEVVTQKVRFDPVERDEPDGDQERVHVFVVQGATFVDKDLVGSAIDTMRDRVLKAKEEAAGVTRLPYDDESEFATVDELGKKR
jgi:hypothetical protein